jgi:hypothetical protein
MQLVTTVSYSEFSPKPSVHKDGRILTKPYRFWDAAIGSGVVIKRLIVRVDSQRFAVNALPGSLCLYANDASSAV